VRGAWWAAILGLLLGAVLGVGLLLYRGAPPGGGRSEGTAADSVGDKGAAVADTLADAGDGRDAALRASRENAIVRATQLVAPAVVSINVIQQQAVRDPTREFFEKYFAIPHRDSYEYVRSLGSGVIVSSDGLVVTNEHVVQGAVQLLVTLSDGRQFQGVVVEEVDRYDLAVLRIEAQDLPVARLADSDDLQIGEWAIAIGSPFGYLLADTQPTVTVGVISALNRDIARQNQHDRRLV